MKFDKREEAEKQRKDMEERHKEEIRQLEINSLRNQLSQYENKLKEAQTSYMECQKEQARRMESFYRDKDMMEETYLKRIKEVKTEAEKKLLRKSKINKRRNWKNNKILWRNSKNKKI